MITPRLQQVITALIGATVILSSNCVAQDAPPSMAQTEPATMTTGPLLTHHS